ncbi:MAG TPA: hypothetical protein VMV69_00935 [Pirellulales bacterium]|nr:hypothetical protein [Pirellulales bacterium]
MERAHVGAGIFEVFELGVIVDADQQRPALGGIFAGPRGQSHDERQKKRRYAERRQEGFHFASSDQGPTPNASLIVPRPAMECKRRKS